MLNTNWYRGRQGVGGGGGGGSFTYQGTSTGNTGFDLGEEAPDRRIYVAIAWGKSRFGQNGYCSAVTVNGVPATWLLGDPSTGPAYDGGVSLWEAEVPTGTTDVDVIPTMVGGGFTAVWRTVYRAAGLASYDPSYSFYHRTNPIDIYMPEDGYGIIAGCKRGTFSGPQMLGDPLDPVMDYGLHVSGSGGSGTTYQVGHYSGVPEDLYTVSMGLLSASLAIAWNL